MKKGSPLRTLVAVAVAMCATVRADDAVGVFRVGVASNDEVAVAMPFMHYIGFGQRIMDLKAELCRKYVCQGGKQMAERKICEARFLGWKSGVAFAEGYSSYRVPLSGGHTLFDGLPPVTE